MSLFDGLRHRLRSVLGSGQADRERAEEYALHDALASGHEFQNATYVKEEVRWMGAMRWVDSISQDLRYTARTLRRSPVFTAVAVASLGLGVGANALIFGVIHSLLLTKLAVADPDQLRILSNTPEGRSRAFFSAQEVQALLAVPRADVALWYPGGSARAEIGSLAPGGMGLDPVSGTYFRVAGVRLAAGRGITEQDEHDAARVAVLGYDQARAGFGSAEAAVGKTIKLNNLEFTVIGVSGAGYLGLSNGSDYTLSIPAATFPTLQNRPAGPPQGPAFIVTRLGRDSATTKQALTSAFNACCAAGQLNPVEPYERGELGFIDVRHGTREGKKVDVRAQYANTLFALMGGVAVLLLIACTNVGNLLMARASARARELAVRLSLGASRGRIVRQLLVESLVLAVVGATAGFAISLWGSGILARNLPSGLAMLGPFVALRPSLPILGFTAAVAVACALVFGVVPAIRATRGDVVAGLRDNQRGGRRSRFLDRGIVALQVGLALLLMSAAGLLSATLRNLSESVGGSNPKTLLAVQIDSRGTPHSDTAMQAAAPTLHAKFLALPGVKSVAESYVVPLIYGGLPTRMINVAGMETRPNDEVEAATFAVAAGYFETLGIDIRTGRDFGASDVVGAPRVAVISETAARQYFPGKNPIGEMIGIRGEPRDIQVIGVVADAKQVDLRSPAPRTVYLSYAQARSQWGDRVVWAIRTTASPAEVAPLVRAAILEELPNIRIRHVHPMTDLLALTTGKERMLTLLAVAFGVLAVVLAAIGLYGVMAFQVSARRREIGVRMALGADRGQVVRMVLGQGLTLVVIGVLAGIPLSLIAAKSLTALLYGISPFSLIPLAIGAVVLALAGVLASLIPSSNAARVDPLVAIRSE
jgi:putative ABC transport system permease protein